jgi:hypothetical protein
MSPHMDNWGIPSPVEELYCTPETDSPLDDRENALAGGSQFFVQKIECSEEGGDSLPKRSNRSVPFPKEGMARPDKIMKSRSGGRDMRENSFEAYKIRVFKATHKIDRNANPASLGETLIRHYFNAGYTERSAATAVVELVTVQTPFRPSAHSLQTLHSLATGPATNLLDVRGQ